MADKPKPFPTFTTSDSDERTETTLVMDDNMDGAVFSLRTVSKDEHPRHMQHSSEQALLVTNIEALKQIHLRLGDAIERMDKEICS